MRFVSRARVVAAAVVVALTCAVLTGTAMAEPIPAFPGAEGFGRFATGARTNLDAATVYHVTNRNDAGEGSFRDAVSQPNRFVVFDVGGVIHLKSAVSVKPNVTLAGQTAPGAGGVTLYGAKVSFTGADNAIVRHLAFRKGTTTKRDDAVSLAAGENLIFDHCSVTWGNDETFSMNPSRGKTIDRITVQNTIIGQGLDNVNHSAGGLMQPSGGVSVLRCLFIDNETRNPKVKGTNQFINNVVYNWTTAAYILGGESEGKSRANIVGNVFIAGPAQGKPSASPFSRANANFSLYAKDNHYDANRNGQLDGEPVAEAQYGPVTWQAEPFDFPAVEARAPAPAFEHVVKHVGPTPARRNAVDARLVDELKSLGKSGGIVKQETDLFPDFANTSHPTAPRPADADNDGIADAWEQANGLSAADPTDWKQPGKSGYTRLEEYLNALADEATR